jgi:hypothetical protein
MGHGPVDGGADYLEGVFSQPVSGADGSPGQVGGQAYGPARRTDGASGDPVGVAHRAAGGVHEVESQEDKKKPSQAPKFARPEKSRLLFIRFPGSIFSPAFVFKNIIPFFYGQHHLPLTGHSVMAGYHNGFAPVQRVNLAGSRRFFVLGPDAA